ncbi:MAG: hypothetical protein LBF51_03740 [Zoogloeaceae bacterium]|jgi:hypothetical protein|nr:hypothetical protein [Zoogloeaceae bacterium]
MQTTTQTRLLSGLAVLAALLLYARVLGYGYLYDDMFIFQGTISTLLDAFDLDALFRPFLTMSYFRPLTLFSFWLDIALVGDRPGFLHAVNLALFLANILLVFSICRRLAEIAGRPHAAWRAFAAALIYALHPVMVETTTWISGRFDILATTLILGATRVYLSRHPGRLLLAAFALLAFLATLAKETGVMLLPGICCLALAIAVTRHEAPLSRAHLRQCFTQNGAILKTALAVVLLYAAARLTFEANPYLDYAVSVGRENDYAKYPPLLLALETLKFYFHQALFPFATMMPQHPVKDVIALWSVTDILGNLVTLAALGALLFCALRRASAAAWIFLAGMVYLVLVLHIFPIRIGGNLGNERFLTTPLAFWAIAAALTRWEAIFATPVMQRLAAGMNVLSPRLLAQIVAAAWLAMLAWTTHTTIPFWRDGVTLWSWSVQAFPHDAFSRQNYLGNVLKTAPEAAEKAGEYLFQKSGYLSAKEATALANTFLIMGDRKAIRYLEALRKGMKNDSLNIHLQPDAESRRAKLSEEEIRLISYYYLLFSMSNFILQKNPLAALQENETAVWYLRGKGDLTPKDTYAYDSRRAAYLYGLGFFDAANRLRDKLAEVRDVDKEAVNKSLEPLLDAYCKPAETATGNPSEAENTPKTETMTSRVCEQVKTAMATTTES